MKIILSALIIPIILFGCSESKSPTQRQINKPLSNKDSVKILSASPAITETLKTGASLKIIYEVQYNLASADTGSLALVIQGASNETLSNEFYVVQKGSGTEVLEAEIIVPQSRAVQVFTPLSPQGSSSTSIVESRLYKVEQ
jgi:hypothetical protein